MFLLCSYPWQIMWERVVDNELGEHGRRQYRRLSVEERSRFLAVLGETGNRKAAAAAIGVEPRLMDQRRESDPELDRDWEAAVEAAHRRLSGANGPFDCPQNRKLNMIRRGKKGRLQLVASGEDRWNAAVERRFFEALRACGSVRGAAHAVGFSEGAVWDRRRKWPAFAEALEELLNEAELALQLRIACMGNNVLPTEDDGSGESEVPPVAPVPLDPDFALRFLKWREEKRRGRGRSAPLREPSIEEVRDEVLRRLDAIRRHRKRREGGDGGDSPA
jgi:hypothetical protein